MVQEVIWRSSSIIVEQYSIIMTWLTVGQFGADLDNTGLAQWR
ncbi:hypothetical protein [Candidatus Erwinia haradaeae]|nr:hypothetical protein [Candidatus Erwinia haradaeae]